MRQMSPDNLRFCTSKNEASLGMKLDLFETVPPSRRSAHTASSRQADRERLIWGGGEGFGGLYLLFLEGFHVRMGRVVDLARVALVVRREFHRCVCWYLTVLPKAKPLRFNCSAMIGFAF